MATISIGTFQGYFDQARDGVREAEVKNIVNHMKAARATQEDAQFQPGFGNNLELFKDLLEEGGLDLPSSDDLSTCYAYGYIDNDFFIAITNSEGVLTIDGTPNGVDAARTSGLNTTKITSRGGSLQCSISGAPSGYTILSW